MEVKNLIDYYKDNELLSDSQKKTLIKYNSHLVLKGNSVSTRINSMKVLFYIGRDLKKPYKNVTKEDIINFFSNYTIKFWKGAKFGKAVLLDTNKKPSRNTLRSYEGATEQFFRWLGKKKLADYLKSVKPRRQTSGRAKPSDVWSISEIKKLIESAGSLRSKTAIAVLYEMAGRIKEAMNLNIGDVKFNEDGTTELKINESKTEEGRRMTRFLFETTPLLKEYIEWHPEKNNPDAPLFINTSDQSYKGGKRIQRLNYGGWRNIIRYAHKRSGVKKKLYLHLLRVSRASNMIKEGYSLPIVQKMGAWRSVNSMKPYLKLADNDVKNALLRKNGVEIKEEDYDALKPRKCLKCGKTYSHDKKYCNDCNLPLDPKEFFEQKRRQELKDRFLDMLMRKVDVKNLAMEKSSESVEIVDLLREYNGLKK